MSEGREVLRHHTWTMVENLLRRALNELKLDIHRKLIRFLYQDLKSSTESADTAYTKLSYGFNFLKWLEEKGLDASQVTDLDIKEYLAQFATAASRNVRLQTIRRLAKLAAKYLGLEGFEKAAKEVKYARIRIELPKIPRPEDVEKLIQHAKQPYRSVLILLYEGGLRLSEALSLKYGDVELWDYGYRIHVRTSKSRARVVYIIKYQQILHDWLEQHRSKDPNDWLFYSSTGNPLRPSTFRMYLYRLTKNLGIDPRSVHPHALRHLRATELYKSRALTELEMMKLFGWRTRMMIDVYAMITQDDVEESLARLYGLKIEKKLPGEEDRVACPRCGFINPKSARYCMRCSQPLEENEVMDKIREVEQLRQVIKRIAEILKKRPEMLEKLFSAQE